MVQSRTIAVAAIAAALSMVYLGCGTSDEEEVARVLESYPHALAARDAQGACEAWSQSSRTSDFCTDLQETVSEITRDQRRRLAATAAVRVEVEGDRATGYLNYGDCILTASAVELGRNDAGDWRLERWLTLHETGRCLDD